MAVSGYFAVESISDQNLRSAQRDAAERTRIIDGAYAKLHANFDYHSVLVGKTPAGPYGVEIADREVFRAEQKCNEAATRCALDEEGSRAFLYGAEPEYDFLKFKTASIARRLLACSQVDVQCIERDVLPLAKCQ